MIDHSKRICIESGCNKLGQLKGKFKADGTPTRRNRCDYHHRVYQADKKGISVASWTNSWHIYRKHRKDFCENTDGRLGYVCDATIHWEGQLEVDHIDGNHNNNDPNNLQTFCSNCHKYKTNRNKDFRKMSIKSTLLAS